MSTGELKVERSTRELKVERNIGENTLLVLELQNFGMKSLTVLDPLKL